jgi:hypothetical protein
MPTVQQLLNTVDTTYRNTYSTTQKIEWMDITQKQIFQTVRHEALPWQFQTVKDFAFYPLPDDCDPMGIKQVNIETKPGSNRFYKLPFVNIESSTIVDYNDEFYSIEANQNFYINPIPTEATEGRTVFVYYNKRPATLSVANLTAFPDLEEDFQELLVLGCLIRICRARGEMEDKAMFQADYNKLLKDYQDMYDTPYPEYKVTTDKLPKRRGQVHVKGFNRYPYGFLPQEYL